MIQLKKSTRSEEGKKTPQDSPDQSLTLRTTQSELQLVRKVSSWFKCLLKMCRPCRKKKIEASAVHVN